MNPIIEHVALVVALFAVALLFAELIRTQNRLERERHIAAQHLKHAEFGVEWRHLRICRLEDENFDLQQEVNRLKKSQVKA